MLIVIRRIEDLKLEWVFETIESTSLPFLIPLFFRLEKEQGQEQEQLCCLSHWWQSRELSLISGHLPPKYYFHVTGKQLTWRHCVFVPSKLVWGGVGEGEGEAFFYIKAFKSLSHAVKSTEPKSVSQPNFSKCPLLIFSSHFSLEKLCSFHT